VLVITVDAGLGLSIATVTVKEKPARATVQITADLVTGPAQAPGDVMAVTFDGTVLFAVPLSGFATDRSEAGVLRYRAKDLHVVLELREPAGSLTVMRSKVQLGGFTPENGAEVVVRLGDAVATETVPLAAGHGGRLAYQR
jgi:hypothetical protein